MNASLSRTCATRGTRMTLTIETRPHASIAVGVGYSDGDAHGNLTVGPAGGDGMFVWHWVLSPEVPNGKAQVLISAQDRQPVNDYEAGTSGETSEEILEFEVKSKC